MSESDTSEEPARSPGEAATLPTSRLAALQYRDFRLLLVMQLASSMRQPTLFLTQAWYVNTVAPESQRVVLLGLLAALRGIAFLSYVLFGGTFADRFPRVTVLTASHAVGLVSILIVGSLLLIPSIADGDGPWLWVMLALFASFGLMTAQDQPTRTAMVRDAVPEHLLSRAITQHQMVMSFGVVAAPFAGWSIDALGFGVTYLLAGLGHVVVLITLRGISTRTAADPGASRTSVLRNLGDGIAVLRTNAVVRWTVFTNWAVAALGMSVMGVLVANWVSDVLELDALGWGVMVVTWGIGGVVGSIWLNWRGDVRHMGAWYLGAGALMGCGVMAFGFSRAIVVAFFFNGVVGMAYQLILTWGVTIVQREVPNRLLGRVTGLLLLAGGLMQIAGLGMGLLAKQLGIETVYPLAGLAIVVFIALLSWRQRPLRELD
ncbi:MAG: MFS transporter [Chloroflexi bacterium]|nr:MFS transporter [Chloroflexota bacterium]MDA1146933.1 MFS transporter [Chloroflexota bacterium]MQC82370.1 MFS transporter [Chloroflexota bacterium]MQC82988.1 MFS transporter [Chloroflexota bacterium]